MIQNKKNQKRWLNRRWKADQCSRRWSWDEFLHNLAKASRWWGSFPGYLSQWRTTSGCSESRFLEHILNIFHICDLEKKVTVWTWSCLSELFFTNLKETTYWNILLLRLVLTWLWGSWRWWWYQEHWHQLYWLLQPWHWRHERGLQDQVQEKLLGLLASWVRLTTCSTLVKVRILLRIVKFGIEFFLTIFCD